MIRWVLVVITGAVVGCASLSPPPRPSATVLVRADRLVAQGQYEEALEAYGEILAKYPDTDEAGRARSSRETLGDLLAARAQITRLTAEVQAQEAQVQAQEAQVKAREAELARARGEVAARDGELARARQEIARLTAEADRLRADLESLKKIDIDLERRRK